MASGFASVDSAARVRDIIKRGAGKVVADVVPGELVGRVVSLDLARRTARVWFTGDEQPVSVKLFSNTLPGQWQSQLLVGQTANTNLSGYGSQVVCQKYRGELYITDVLTGGQFSYDLSTMNQRFVSTNPYSVSPNSAYGQMIAAKVHVHLVSDLNQGEAIEFGPFIKTDDADSSNWVKVYINAGSATLEYEFNMSDTQLYNGTTSLNRWFRVLPCRETSINRFAQREYFDFDVSNQQTVYGKEPSFGVQSNNEYWFRLIKRTSDTSFISANVSIETSLFDKPRSVDGNERLIQNRVTAAVKDISGYVGFHNSGVNISDLHDTKVRDYFDDRTVTNGIGTSFDGTFWTTVNGSASNYSVSNGAARIAATATGIEYTWAHPARVEFDYDTIVILSVNQVMTGGASSAYVQVRRQNGNNYYSVSVDYQTSGSINLVIQKKVAGVVTALQTAVGASSYTANATHWVRFQIRNDKLRAKIWSTSSAEPTAWTLTHNSDTSLTPAGVAGVTFIRSAGNTNTGLELACDYYESNLSQQTSSGNGIVATGPWRSPLLMTAQRLQHTVTMSGGNFTWDGTSLGWTGEIMLTGIGRHRSGLQGGSMYIACPRNTSNYVFPVYGGTSVTTVNATANGVPLAAGRSLYVAIPPGERNVDIMENLFLVDSVVNGINFELPEWAVLIAHRQPGTEVIRLATGEWPVNEVRFEGVGNGTANVGGGYTSMAGGTFNFTKHRTNTKLELDLRGSSIAGAVNDKIDAALQINGVDYSVAQFLHSAANRHDSWSGIHEVPAGVAMGTYTVTIRYQRIAGAGSITINADDLICAKVRELPL